MAREIRWSLAILILFTALASSGIALAQGVTTEQNVVIVLPSGVTLQPGSYNGVIEVSGNKISIQIKVLASAQPSSPASPDGSASTTGSPPQPGSSPASTPGWIEIALAALVPVLLIALGALAYFKIIAPRKQIEPYRQALDLTRDKKYGEALPLLTQVESKLPDRLRRDARFFIAFAHFQLNNAQQAEFVLDALLRENHKDAGAAYLLAYIRVQAKRYDEAEPVLERMQSNNQLNVHHAKKLLGIVKFRRALTALKEGRVEAAGELFEQVQTLGDFADQIPPDLRNHQIVLGTKALFDKDLAEARKHFEGLEKAVSQSPEEQRSRLLATAKTGLALVEWIEAGTNAYSTIENLLAEVVNLLDPQGILKLPWPMDTSEKRVVEKLKDLEAKKDQPAEEKEVNRWLRDVHFLRGMTVLRSWLQMDGEAAHQAIAEKYDSALSRFACSYARDEDFADVWLVVGLLMYYLRKPGAERSQGIDLLQRAQKLGMHDPDAVEIINNRERIEKANADAVDKYLQLLDKYLADETVRKEVRLALLERLSKYKRIQSWEKRPDLAPARSVEPTLAEVRNRSEILLTRVEQILTGRVRSEEVNRVRDLSYSIAHSSQQLYDQAKAIEEKESQLLVETGNRLFMDQ